MSEHWQKCETQQHQLNHGSEPDNTELNQVSSSLSHIISSFQFLLLWLEVRTFSKMFYTFILNIYNHLIVIMISKVNEGAGGSKNVTRKLVTLESNKEIRGFKNFP